jgi:hypothetical protein
MASRMRTDETKCKPPLASRSQSHRHDGGRSGNNLESSLFRTAAHFPEQMILNWPKLDYCKHSSPSYKDFSSEYAFHAHYNRHGLHRLLANLVWRRGK